MKRFVLSLLVLALAVPVFADDPCVVGRSHEAIVNFLQMTPDQVSQWDALIADRETVVTPLRDQLDAVKQQLAELLSGPDPDPTEVGNLTIQAHDLGQQIRAANQTYIDGFEGMLNEEQTGKLGLVRHADQVRPLLPAFRLFGLIPRNR